MGVVRTAVPIAVAVATAASVAAAASQAAPRPPVSVAVEADGFAPAEAPDAGAAVAEVLRGAAGPDLAERLAALPEVRRAVSAALAFLRTPGGSGAAVEVGVDAAAGRTVVRVAVVRSVAPTPSRSPDGGVPRPVRVPLGETRVVVTRLPHARPAPRAMAAPRPPAPDAIPLRGKAALPCGPGDAACWGHALASNPLACEAYAAEALAHEQALSGSRDPNLGPSSPPPDVDAPREVREKRVAAVAGPLPDGLAGIDPAADPKRAPRLANGPPTPAGPPGPPASACRTEWESTRAIPTPGCTRDVVAHDRWDGSAASTLAAIPLVRDLPGVSHWIGMRALAEQADLSWQGVYAARWIDRFADRLEAGDTRYLDEAAAAVRADPEARAILAPRLRRFLSEPAAGRWHDAIRVLYREHFLALYPEAADPGAAGLPAMDRFPVRSWWASNWLAEVARRGMPASEAVARLRCGPDADRAIATLSDLLPAIAGSHPRLAAIATLVSVELDPAARCR